MHVAPCFFWGNYSFVGLPDLQQSTLTTVEHLYQKYEPTYVEPYTCTEYCISTYK